MTDVAYIGVGANLGDARAKVREAFLALASLPGVAMAARSSLWETSPVGPVADQPWFVNGCVGLSFAEPPPEPEALLEQLLALERKLGRDRASEQPQGPRVIDLDLLVWGERVVITPALRLPHPRLAGRAFALAPLVEIAGEELVIPGAGHAGALLDAALEDGTQELRRI